MPKSSFNLMREQVSVMTKQEKKQERLREKLLLGFLRLLLFKDVGPLSDLIRLFGFVKLLTSDAEEQNSPHSPNTIPSMTSST